MTVQDVKNYLGETFRYEFVPNRFATNSPKDCASVKLWGGEPSKYIKGIKDIGFQVLVRAKHPSTAEAMSYEIFEHFNGREHFNMGTIRIDFCLADQSVPVYIGESEQGLAMYSINFSCKVRG